MISPIDQTNTQKLSLEGGYGSTYASESSGGTSPDVSDDLLDSIQQNYSPLVASYKDTALWQLNLNGDRVRPYLDVGIHPYANEIRLPVVSHNYDIYADNATFYEDVNVEGNLDISGQITGNVSFDRNIEVKTSDFSVSADDRSKLFHIEPSGGSVVISLPADIPNGFNFEVVNCLEGKFTTLSPDQGQLKAKGTGLSQPYSACVVYRFNSSWYAIGDLTA